MKRFLIPLLAAIALPTAVNAGHEYEFDLMADKNQINIASLEKEYYEIERSKAKEEECFKDKVRRSYFGSMGNVYNHAGFAGNSTVLVYNNGIERWTRTFSNNYKCKNDAFFEWNTPHYRLTTARDGQWEIYKIIFKKPINGSIIAYQQLWQPYRSVPPIIDKFEAQIWHFTDILAENYKLPDGDIFDISTGEIKRGKRFLFF